MIKRDPSAKHPKYIYMNRRHFLVKAVPMAAGAALLAACSPSVSAPPQPTADPNATRVPTLSPNDLPSSLAHADPFSNVTADELGDPLNTFDQITNYNNYYEFSTDKEAVAQVARNFTTSPWTVEVNGLVNKPRTFSIEQILKEFPQEEHVYRLRCVEAWSMVIPWVGFNLSDLLQAVEPKPEATYVKFVTVMRSSEMPNQSTPILQWPYVEGLRLDEANNNLTILATGMYGKPLTPQQGAPIRLVVPWKYGFKSIKAVVQIELTTEPVDNTWRNAASNEYGFYANVNPEVDHPRWSQATERRIGEFGRRRTLMFNGYEAQVADMYSDLDLRANY
jgi:sulfoxide reductase catalytic subunit YedY